MVKLFIEVIPMERISLRTAGAVLAVLISLLLVLSTMEACASSTPIGWEHIRACIEKMPEFYSGAADPRKSEYRELVRTLFDSDPGAAKWVVDTGLFMEDLQITKHERTFVSRITQESCNLLRILISKRVLDGVTGRESFRRMAFDLEDDLEQLPEVQDGLTKREETALTQIRQMAQVASQQTLEAHEIRKGLYLIDEYGIPDFGSSYRKPRHNTQLQVLLWLLSEIDVPQDYWKVALAAGLVYGAVVTIGDDQVDAAVRSYVPQMVEFIMDTDQLSKLGGIEGKAKDYPIDACLGLVWGAPATRYWVSEKGQPGFWSDKFRRKQMTIEDFNWFFVDIDDLRSMQEWMLETGFVDSSIEDPAIDMRRFLLGRMRGQYDNNIDKVMADLNDYFYFGKSHCRCDPNELVEVEGRKVLAGAICNPSFQWDHFGKTNEFYGTCGENTTAENMFAKSVGIGAFYGIVYAQKKMNKGTHTYTHTLIHYYNPVDGVLRTTPCQAHFNNESTGWRDSPPVSHDGQLPVPWQNFCFNLEFNRFHLRGKDVEDIFLAKGFPAGYIFRVFFVRE